MTQTNLASALALAQSEMKPAPMTGYNPHFKSNFSTFEDLIESSRPMLTKYGISVTQYPDSDGDEMYLVTKLKHSSGQEEVSRARIFLKDNTDIQKLGSAITYMKRYAYASICGIATAEGDDDGNTISVSGYTPQQRPSPSSEVKSEFVSTAQLLKLKAMLAGNKEREVGLCKYYAIPTLDKLPWKKMQDAIAILEAGAAKEKQPPADPVVNDMIF